MSQQQKIEELAALIVPYQQACISYADDPENSQKHEAFRLARRAVLASVDGIDFAELAEELRELEMFLDSESGKYTGETK